MPAATLSTTRSSSPDKVANHVLQGIKSGRFVPGQRLIEADLSETLYTSRGPIREAFKRLAAEGVLTLVPHRGAYVRTLTRREVTDVLVIQETLTALAARLATENIHVGDNREQFQHVVSQVSAEVAHHDLHELLDRRAEFYATLVFISGNEELGRFVPIPQTNLLRTQFVRHLTIAERKREQREYELVAKYVLSGAPQQAENAMRRHIRNSRQSIERLPDDAFAIPLENNENSTLDTKQ
ncbi:MAG: GntR family transcriptional regulator [Pseudomonadota bacterium]